MEDLSRQLAAAMRGFASSVTIISAVGADGGRQAMTATSPTSVSLDPPSMLVCVHRGSSFYATVGSGADFSINILHADQLDIAQLCSSPERGEARFRDSAWRYHISGVPYLTNAQSAIICRRASSITHGTHEIIIGEVVDVHLSELLDPLVYAGGAYRTLARS